jgi:cytoskeletal protein CcmA (bactofilin family)
MSLFNRSETKRPALRPATNGAAANATTRTANETAEDVKLLNNEPAPRRNVPAVAMGSQRRPAVSMSMPTPMRGEPGAGEKRLIVGRDIALAGEIADCDQLVVEGTMDATLRAGKRLDIYPSGIFRGAANIQEADIAGEFNGELNVSGTLRLRATARISGTIRYSEIEVEAGAQLSGTFEYVAGSVAANDTTDIPFSYSVASGQ